MYGVLLICGGLAGVTTVLFGFGGGFVVVPLMYITLMTTHGPASIAGAAAMHIAVATSTALMIFAASLSSWRHHQRRTIDWGLVRPLVGYIALGAVLGAAMAMSLDGDWVRLAFIVYLGLTIADAILRPGFLHHAGGHVRPMGRGVTAFAGTVIGSIATLLGVGGSVMTVPLMRRRGASMTTATAMANPLSLPMAITGTLTYVILSANQAALGPWFAGFVDLKALIVLAGGSWLGIGIASRWIGRIPDRIHAGVYLVLLSGVFVTMLVIP
ncbi:sulfite exporter TauE/SafE family protein [Seohaeicola sp. SP36]|uniref:Probable membrane transporter protein n=1 Tax=Roseovarius mucosus TaxID=215743 RepID=A0A1V0RV28_9RHOB|nr:MULTISPECIES: sulfite exporter TauE/SafE family protein [Roseobacteraceae]ARE85535.1 sulfite exporter TauE/SafE [Roseovarius mucosus]MDD9737941.1 sulfite exporter TauE/SafE family protein [Seohaeicola sp. SP36]PKQ11370.1 MAG: sulfite exporter TauE/SafE family protein [Alphaproteobacteria bacterium HGW-Alphaproteobacteria-1]